MHGGAALRSGVRPLTYSYRMARVVVGLVIAGLVFTIFAVVDCSLTERFRVRALPKPLWLLIVLLLPVIGPLLWFLIGRAPTRWAGGRRLPPDDDPDFFGRHRGPSAPPQPAHQEELQRFEEELANLDTDPDEDERPRG